MMGNNGGSGGGPNLAEMMQNPEMMNLWVSFMICLTWKSDILLLISARQFMGGDNGGNNNNNNNQN